MYTGLGGGEIALLHLGRRLDRTRFQPIFLFPSFGPFPERVKQSGIQVEFLPFKPTMLAGLLNPFILFPNLACAIRLKSFARASNIDLIHCSDLFTLLLALPTAISRRIPIVYNAIIFYNKCQRLLLQTLTRRWVRHVIVPSEVMLKHVVDEVGIAGEHVSVIHPAVDPEEFSRASFERRDDIKRRLGLGDKRIVGHIARYDVWKGHETLRRAAEMVVKRRDDVLFLVVGGGMTEQVVGSVKRYRMEFEERTRPLVESGHLKLLGHRDDVAEIYSVLDVFVASSDHEAFGMVVLEAFASGLPLIVTRTTGAMEVIGKCKGITAIDPKNPHQLADAIEEALKSGRSVVDQDERKEVLRNCTWEIYAEKWKEVVEKVLN